MSKKTFYVLLHFFSGLFTFIVCVYILEAVGVVLAVNYFMLSTVGEKVLRIFFLNFNELIKFNIKKKINMN